MRLAWLKRDPSALHRRGGVRRRWIAAGAALLIAAPLAILLLPTPYLDGAIAGLLADRVAGQVSCKGSTAAAPQITIKGGRLVRQALRRRLTEVDLVLPDATVGGVEHASFAATMRDVSQPDGDTVHVGSIDATITVRFASLPAPPDGTKPKFGRASSGLLTVEVTPPVESAKNVKATLFLGLDLAGETLNATPKQLQIFGRTIPADQVAAVTGGVRKEKLPALPDGVAYKSVTPRADGLHVALSGVATTAFKELPATVDGQAVTYAAQDGLLGISTAKDIPLLGALPLTIFTTPTLTGKALKLVPRKVHVLGGDHSPTDLIGKAVLSQVKQESLSRALPTLPNGVRYTGAAVDPSGLKVSLGGVTVKPYSELPPTDEEGRATSYGAKSGLMTVTTRGNSRPTPIVLYAKPVITGSTLDLSPQQIRMFGVQFPAKDVLAQVKADNTKYPLQPLPANLSYGAVEVQPGALRLHVSGKDADLAKGMLGGSGC
jgi:hypothetical protein